MSESPPKKREARALPVLVLAAVLGLLTAVLLSVALHRDSRGPTIDMRGSNAVAADTAQRDKSDKRDLPPLDAADTRQEPLRGTGTRTAAPAPPQDEGPRSTTDVVLEIAGADGRPLSHFEVRYRVAPDDEYFQRLQAVGRAKNLAPAIGPEDGSARSNLSGEARLTLPIPSGGRGFLLVAPASSEFWQIRLTHAQHVSAVWGAGTWHTVWRGNNARYKLVFDELSRITTPISYEDGQPFSGSVQIFLRGAGDFAPPQVQLDLINAGELSFLAPVGANDVHIICTSTRAGFAGRHLVEGGGEWLTNAAAIIIPRVAQEEQAGLRVDLKGYYDEHGWRLHLYKFNDQISTGKTEWGSHFLTMELTPGSNYRVRLENENGDVWESEPTPARAGEIIELVPQPLKSAKIRLRVVDSKGEPLFPSFITTREVAGPRWESVRDGTRRRQIPVAGIAYGDAEGMVEMNRLSPSASMLYVEARNYERLTVPLSLAPGESSDLGDITLEPARGRLVVNLTNYPNDRRYVVTIGSSRSHNIARATIEGGKTRVEFEGLAFRAYRVSIGRQVRHGYFYFDNSLEPIVLSEDKPSAEFTSDYDNVLVPEARDE